MKEIDISPIKIINSLRESDEYIKHIYTEGGCYQFHLFLKSMFTNSEAYISISKNHIISKIGNKFYDIEGFVDVIEVSKKFEKLSINDLDTVEKWSFRKKNMLKLNECPACDEPLVFNLE